MLQTEFYTAVKESNYSVVRRLLQRRINLELADPNGIKALYYAVAKQDSTMVEILLTHGAIVEENDQAYSKENLKLSFNPLELAVYLGNYNIVNLIFKFSTNKEANNSTLKNKILLKAVEFDQPDLIPLLIKYAANPNYINSVGKSTLSIAIEQNNLSLIRLLLRNKANPDLKIKIFGGEFSPLHYGIIRENLALVKLLLEYHTKINRKIFNLAWRIGNEAIIKIINESYEFQNRGIRNKLELFKLAIKYNKADLIEQLIVDDGLIILEIAINTNNSYIIKLLLTLIKDLDLKIKNHHNNRFLFFMAEKLIEKIYNRRNNPSINDLFFLIQTVIELKKDLNFTNVHKQNFLHVILTKFLEKINLISAYPINPLVYRVRDLLAILIQAKVDIYAKDLNEKTPLAITMQYPRYYANILAQPLKHQYYIEDCRAKFNFKVALWCFEKTKSNKDKTNIEHLENIELKMELMQNIFNYLKPRNLLA